MEPWLQSNSTNVLSTKVTRNLNVDHYQASTITIKNVPTHTLKLVISVILFLNLAPPVYGEDVAESLPFTAVRANVAIIIDDLGYGLSRGQQFVELPFSITLAVIPFTPYGERLAKFAHERHKEVMLHAPMETLSQRRWEPQSLKTTMSETELIAQFAQMLANVPYVQGVNNHGGSRLTQDKDRMSWLMAYLAQQQLYFVDSRTTPASRAIDAARSLDVPHLTRDIFLDNDRDPARIRRQLDKLKTIAVNRGTAIAIGHPYPETFTVLEEVLPRFIQNGIRLVPISALAFQNSPKPIPLLATRPAIPSKQTAQ